MITLAFMAANDAEAVLLARSLRAFGGDLADSPVWALYPGADPTLSDTAQRHLADLDVRPVACDVPAHALTFPLAAKAYAAAAAEALAPAGILAWLDSDTLIIQEPVAFNLPADRALGYRPVHHTLIGSPYDAPLDPFWSLVYERCGVPAAHVFPMTTVVDRRRLRPYFNAGCLIVRPERGLLRAWRDRFDALYRDPAFQPFYDDDVLYAVFVHQAVLSGVLLAELAPDACCQLSPLYNYPLNLHDQHPPDDRPATINEVITCRYDTVFENPGWRDALPAGGDLRRWIFEHVTGC